MSHSSLHVDQNERLRDILKKRVPPYSSHRLTKDLCEEVIKSFGSIYPDEALSLCMKVAQRVALENRIPKRKSTEKKPDGHEKKARGRRAS